MRPNINVNGTVREMNEQEYQQYLEDNRQAAELLSQAELEWANSLEGRMQAQLYYTAVLTDTLMEE